MNIIFKEIKMNVYVPKQYRREKLLKTTNSKTYQNNKGKRKRRTKEREKEGGREGGKYGRPLLSTVPLFHSFNYT